MDLFDVAAKISLDTKGYERGLDDASSKTSSFAVKLLTLLNDPELQQLFTLSGQTEGENACSSASENTEA